MKPRLTQRSNLNIAKHNAKRKVIEVECKPKQMPTERLEPSPPKTESSNIKFHHQLHKKLTKLRNGPNNAHQSYPIHKVYYLNLKTDHFNWCSMRKKDVVGRSSSKRIVQWLGLLGLQRCLGLAWFGCSK